MERKKSTKIVFTGGPCAGKTTIIPLCIELLRSAGKVTFCISEAATTVMNSGVTVSEDIVSSLEFQRTLFKYQIYWESMLEDIQLVNDKEVIILCDRSLIDSKAYMENRDLWFKLLEEFNMNEVELFSRYDYIVHLKSAAYGAEYAYTCSNNSQRKEGTIEDARKVEDSIVNAYLGVSPNIIEYIDNSTDFDTKVQRAINSIFGYLGLAKPNLKQRKFIVNKEKFLKIAKSLNANTRSIEQVYLKSSNSNVERKVRKIGDGHAVCCCYYTEKYLDNSCGVREYAITPTMYQAIVRDEKNIEGKVIKKTRYYFSKDSIYYNLDVFEKEGNNAILEARTSDVNNNINFEYDGIFKEVTEDNRFRNYYIAKEFPKELLN